MIRRHYFWDSPKKFKIYAHGYVSEIYFTSNVVLINVLYPFQLWIIYNQDMFESMANVK